MAQRLNSVMKIGGHGGLLDAASQVAHELGLVWLHLMKHRSASYWERW